MPRADNFSRFLELRREFPWFSYDAYDYHYSEEALDMRFSFDLSGKVKFSPHTRIPIRKNIFIPIEKLPAGSLDNLVFHIGMIELVSYWKAACPPLLMVRPFRLAEKQSAFWKKLYFNGLGEFFYTNSIDTNEDGFMSIQTGPDKVTRPFSLNSPGGRIVPVGGGKDSAVTMGLLNRSGLEWVPFVINPRGATRRVIASAGKDEPGTIVAERKIDPVLLQLNSRGYLNGHTPFSALLAFYSLLAACLSGHDEIILSNESSANEPTIPGTGINHQYSKSFEFERDFREYTRTFISPDFNYFSLLRPLNELGIAKRFSGMPEFFQSFRSCNAGSKTDSWCGKCPKCLFTYIILSPFVESQALVDIFGKNLLEDLSLKEILDELTGRSGSKPFECIGTIDEVNAAIQAVIENHNEENLPELLRYYQSVTRPGTRDSIPELLQAVNPGHFVPQKYLSLLFSDLA